MASTLAFVGRFLFALLFLASGFQKLMTYEPSKGGGAVAHMVSDKLQTTFKSVHELTGVEVPLHKVNTRPVLTDSPNAARVVNCTERSTRKKGSV